MVPETTVEDITVAWKDFSIVALPEHLRSFQGTGGDAETNEVETLNRLYDAPTSFSFESHDTFIDEAAFKKKVDMLEVNPDRDVEELDLEDTMHPGIFCGARQFRKTRIHTCQLCGFRAHNPAYFCIVDGCGQNVDQQSRTTDEFMVGEWRRNLTFWQSVPQKTLPG